jgi:hypothetical protein
MLIDHDSHDDTKTGNSVPNVAPGSNTETYIAMQLEIDNWRWPARPFARGWRILHGDDDGRSS